ncbi:Magnesium and cobalt efflux protein CorC [Sedimentisphaera cyanobacteriorum]|uniref:Magnesium and cobalt efflux protein CorC n=1 Tax=Sedimentisphaera cyanobacteriorum TaxID=1940790 RepID=A0A1Q2HMA4_9BACT|nr:hemolysin family protein [Sedimentisphaera cyanobacteriorum]AQQ08363.1 Magnesium and cobalt efflux protein CorC [Sedimentisphaera cyanobacteriorum]
METIIQQSPQIISLILLLAISGFFSGSETAFFNLSFTDRKKLRTSKTGETVLRLISRPKSLLNTLLFGNMIINVLYFSAAGQTAVALAGKGNTVLVTLYGIVSLFLLIIFGEIMPKSIAFSHSQDFCTLTAYPVYICQKLLAPIASVLNIVFIKPAVRLTAPAIPRADKIGLEHLRYLVKNSGKKGLINQEESELISRVMELGKSRVKEIMRPRVDIVMCEKDTEIEDVFELMRSCRVKKIPVYQNSVDNICGYVHQRDILTKNPDCISDVLRSTVFLPEQKSVESLLEFFLETKNEMAMIVDEYGGISGLATIKDVVESITSGFKGKDNSIEQISENKYRLSGSASLLEWLELIELPNIETDYSTISGFIISNTRKIPRKGDSVRYQNLKFTVEQVEENRIKTVLVELE